MARRKRHFGSIRRLPSGRRQARYTCPVTGQVITAPRTFTTVADAEAWLAAQLTDLRRGEWTDPTAGDVTLGDFARGWLAGGSWRPSTRALYEGLVERFVLAAVPTPSGYAASDARPIGDRPMWAITPATVALWHQWVQASCRASAERPETSRESSPGSTRALRRWAQDHGHPVAPTGRLPGQVHQAWVQAGRPALEVPRATASETPGRTRAAQAYRCLHAVFSAAVQARHVRVNPCQLPGAGVVKAAERRPVTVEELARLAACSPPRYRAAVLLAAWGALRAGEVFGLRVFDLDVEASQVLVRRSITHVPGEGFHTGPPKSDAGMRTVTVHPELMATLAEHVAAYCPNGDSLLFATSNGTSLHSSNRTAWFRRAVADAGLRDLHFHDLRHTGATLAAQTGATVADLMRRLGHSSPRAALIYQHAARGADQRIADGLGKLARGA